MKKRSVFTLVLMLVSTLLALHAAADESFAAKTYTPAEAGVTAIHIDVRDRSIEVSPSADGQIHIDYWESDKEFYTFSVSDDHVLTITAANSKTWRDFFGAKPSGDFQKISLQVPDFLLSSLSIKTTNRDVLLHALTVQDTVALAVTGGKISFENLSVGSALNLNAKNGDIQGSISGRYEDFSIACKSKKGESNMPSLKKEGHKTLQIASNNGDVSIEFAPPQAPAL